MRRLLIVVWLSLAAVVANGQQSHDKLREVEKKLDQASDHIQQLTSIIESLRAEIANLKTKESRSTDAGNRSSRSDEKTPGEFAERVVGPAIGASERGNRIEAKPEVFIQTRYSAAPIRDTGSEFEPNISLNRIESRWAGRISNQFGAGLEIQFHPAIDGSPEELVNDAFIEYYPNEHLTIRVGQFIKPFGFDIQQSSAVRESPERGIFAGYFFPGQRDRGVMLFGTLDFARSRVVKNMRYFVAAFNGNRFFADNNRQMNLVARVRKLFDQPKLAIGASVQRGKQSLPPLVTGNNDENLAGVDLQLALGRFGLRAEFAAGNTPSTLLGIEPEFAEAFHPGANSAGGHVFATYRLSGRNSVYARYDQFNRDPVKGYNVRAFNFGYFRDLSEFSRLSFDYQFKNRPSFNDDAVNGRLNISWAIEF